MSDCKFFRRWAVWSNDGRIPGGGDAVAVRVDPHRKRPEPHPEQPPLDDLAAELTPWLLAQLRGFRIDPQLREDVVQDAWVQFLLNRHRINDPSRTAAWLRTTATRRAMRMLSRSRELPTHNVDVPSAADPAVEVSRAVLEGALLQAIDRLPARDRRLVCLIASCPELSYADLAVRLGVAENSIGQLRTRCLRRLRRILERQDITDAGA